MKIELYSNSFLLGDFQETLNDATAAVQLEPTFIKAIERGRLLLTCFILLLTAILLIKELCVPRLEKNYGGI